MNNPNCWRVPTPTDINNIQEFTALERAIFREILALCQSKNTLIHFVHNDRHYRVELKRGQCIFRVSAFAKDLNLNRKKVRGSLGIISKWYSQLDIQGMPYGLIITVKNYDEIINMNNQENNQGTIKEQSRDNQGTPNKSDKNVKNVKNDNKQRGDELYETFINGFNKVTGKKFKGSDTVKASLNARLQEGFTMKQIGMAILRASKSKYLCGENEDGKWYLTPEYILRRNKLDEWTNQSDKKEERRSI